MTDEAGAPSILEPATLTDLIECQIASVVSRTLMKKDKGAVTLFAFDTEEGMSEHTAPFDALVYGLDGEAEIIVVGREHRVCGGEILLLPVNRPHSVRACARFKMLLIMIRS